MKKLLTGIILLGLAADCQASWTLIDSFDSYDNSGSTLLSDGITGGVWDEIPVGDNNAQLVDDMVLGGQTVAVYGPNWRGAETDLKNNFTSDFSLADGATATYFFQFMAQGDSYDCMFGLARNTANVDATDAWTDYAVMPYIAGGQLKVYGDNIGDTAIAPISTGLWYNVWLVVDNNAKQFDMYWSTGTTNATLGMSNVQFGRDTTAGSLEAFAFSQNQYSTVLVDNLYRTSGADTTFPSTNITIVPPLPPDASKVGGALAGVTNETVYLMCYHEGYYPAGGGSGVFVSWSTNGYDFQQLNDGHPVFVPPEFPGDDADNSDGWGNLVRDPSMIYDSVSNVFRLVFTSDINSRSFGYAESPDLVHWSNVKLVQIWDIWDAVPGNHLTSVDHTWAPEWFYNEDAGNYMIIFSSGVNGASLRMWYTETTDFDTFTAPIELFNNSGITVIDGCVRKVGADYYILAYKNEAAGNQTWIRDSTAPFGPWSNGRQASGGGDEGPCLIQIGGTWHLYWDNFGSGDNVFGLATSADTTNWTDVTWMTDMPAKADVPDYGYDGGPPHHGTVFEAPLSALGAFTEPYEDNVTNLSSLVYRWSFDDAAGPVSSGTIVTDSISGAEAVVNGNRATFTGTGLQLPGDTDATGDAAYLDLPNGMVSALTNLTVEIWATPVASKNWQRLFSFGRTAEAGDGVNGEWIGPASGGTSALNAMYWTLNVGMDLSKQNCAMRDYSDSNKDAVSGTCMYTVPGTQYHYVFTFEDGIGFFGATGGRMTLYRDGFQIGWRDVPFRLQGLEDFNNWLGRSQWSGDSNSNVGYDEVRIYSEALTWYDIYGHYLAGPDVLVDASPELKIGLSGSAAELTWPGNAVGLPKQANELGTNTVWSSVAMPVQNSTNGLSVAVPITADKAFFRLGK